MYLVSCAIDIAMCAICRCPPESSSIKRSRNSSMPVILSACSTILKSRSPSLPPECGNLPKATSSSTLIRADLCEFCPSIAKFCASLRLSHSETLLPSTNAQPSLAGMRRLIIFSIVLLPAPLQPMKAVILFSGKLAETSFSTNFSPYFFERLSVEIIRV